MFSARVLNFLCVIPWCATALQMRPLGITKSRSAMRMMSSSGSTSQVTVVGGTGLVGSRVCKILAEKGVSVTSVSKSGAVPAWCKDEGWASQVAWTACDLTQASEEAIDKSIGQPDAIVSCLGVIGTDVAALVKGNGEANAAAFSSAKRGDNVQRAAFVSVASEVMACQENWLPEFFSGYFDGKKIAEQAALDAVDGNNGRLCLIKPSFIYGGDSFGLLPPRVTTEYGSFIEELLSLPPIKALADVTPGLIKVALRPPSSADAVAAACACAALGEENALGKILDGTAEINEATNQPPATGLSDALEWSKEKAVDAFEWAKVEVPKAVEWSQKKIAEVQKK